MYKLIRFFLFQFDAEAVHKFSMKVLNYMAGSGPLSKFLLKRYGAAEESRPINFLGLNFKNRVGLAAGFDKNAAYLKPLSLLGFGHVEIGTVTPLAQDGNEKPRLFRLKNDRAIINRMGFNNAGMEAVANNLRSFRNRRPQDIIIGGNIGKNKLTPNDDAWKDYLACFKTLHSLVDYFVVNVSSPNTPGLRQLQEKESLRKILVSLQDYNQTLVKQRPILLKVSPDLSNIEVDDVVDLVQEISLNGLVVSNTTIERKDLTASVNSRDSIGPGGLSGKPLFKASNKLLDYIHQRSGGSIPIIASGGIFTADDALEKIDLGATIVQVWTGFIFEGPAITKNILKGLIDK